jgi:hypothetical protein
VSATVYIDESLARGLASRFLSEALDRVIAIEQKVYLINFSTETRKGWLKKYRALGKYAETVSFGVHEVGTKSKPAIAFAGITPDDHQFKSWEERMLTGRVLIFQYDTNIAPDPEPIPFVISHHALMRLFMRCSAVKEHLLNWNFNKILKILSPLPAWSAYWDATITGPSKEHFHSLADSPIPYLAYPVIPSPHGLFFCEVSREDPRVNLRTFVDTEKLRPDQEHLRQILLRAFSGFEKMPLSLHPSSVRWNIWHTDAYIMLLTERLAIDAPFIKSFVYKGLSADQIRLLEELKFLESRGQHKFDFHSYDPDVFYSDVMRQKRRADLQKLREQRKGTKRE